MIEETHSIMKNTHLQMCEIHNLIFTLNFNALGRLYKLEKIGVSLLFSSIFPISFQYIKYVIFLSLSIMCVKWHHKKYALQPSFRFFHILRVYMLCWLAKCTSGTHQMCSQILKGYRKVPILLKTPQILQQSIKTSWFRKINGTFSIKSISDVFENKYFEFVKCTITKNNTTLEIRNHNGLKMKLWNYLI